MRSLLAETPVRRLPVALAHEFMNTVPDHPSMVVLNRIYQKLSPADQLRCRAELYERREARRHNRVATLTSSAIAG